MSEAKAPIWMGIANAWECDEMGHMNVRFYLAKAGDAVALLLADLGVGAASWQTNVQHIRYHRESHAGTPLKIYGQVVGVTATTLDVALRIVSAPDDRLRATLLASLTADAPWPDDFRAGCEAVIAPVPEDAAPRGLPVAAPYPNPTLDIADAAGLAEVGRLIVGRDQVDAEGYMNPHEVVSVISDSVIHLMCRITPARGAAGVTAGVGGAALEQRILHRARARAGDHVTLRSGVIEAGAKTMRFVHWLFNLRTGEAIATVEVVAVAFDLTARRAIAVDDATRARIADLAVAVYA